MVFVNFFCPWAAFVAGHTVVAGKLNVSQMPSAKIVKANVRDAVELRVNKAACVFVDEIKFIELVNDGVHQRAPQKT